MLLRKNSPFITPKKSMIACALAFGLALSGPAMATQADLDKETAKYVRLVQGSNMQQSIRALKKLEWSGVSSNRVYDAIADKLVSLKNTTSKPGQEEAAWLAKGLAYSGMAKYRPVLKDIADNAEKKKVRKYAEQALGILEDYVKWNPVIGANSVSAPSGRLMQHRIANMLNAQEYTLVRLGAKRVYRAHKGDKALVATAAKRLKAEYPIAKKGNDMQIDAVAWLIKVMAESGDTQYQPLLAEIATQAPNKKVKKYAKKYEGYLR